MNVSKVTPKASKTKYSSVAKHAVTVMKESKSWDGKLSLSPYGTTTLFTDEKQAEKHAESLARQYASTPTFKVVVGTLSDVVSAPAPAPIEVSSL